MPRMSKRNKREWELFINPKTGRKNYNDLCRKCLRQCKQSYRVIVVSCRRFAPNWGRKNAPDLQENKEIILDITEQTFYNLEQKKPEVLRTKAQGFLDQLNIEFI